MAFLVTPRVPYYKQDTSKECWFVCLKMIQDHRAGISSPPTEHKTEGLRFSDYEQFASANGLIPPLVQRTDLSEEDQLRYRRVQTGAWTLQHIEVLLRNNGPLWCAVKRPAPHIVVVVGVSETGVIFHDPEISADLHRPLDTFNLLLDDKAPYQFLFLKKD